METDVTQNPVRICDFIRQHRHHILGDWQRFIRAIAKTPTPGLVDHLPGLLDCISDLVEAAPPGKPVSCDKTPKLHALDRLARGLDLSEVADEYALLRTCVLDAYGRVHGSLINVAEVTRFNQAIDAAIREAVKYYALQRNRVLVAVDRLTSSSAHGDGLADLLNRLLSVFVETSAVVDTSSILLLEDDGRLHVRASIGIAEEVKHRWSIAVGETFAGEIAKTREPMLVHDAAHDALVKSPYIRAAGVHALYGVPLIHNDQLLGVAHMGSRSAYDLSDEDKTLFRVLATRAATLIHNALLHASAERRAAELEATLDAIPGEVVIADAQHGIVKANAAALSLMGIASLDEMTDRRDVAARQEMRLADTGEKLTPEQIPFNRALRGETVRVDLIMRHLGEGRDVVLRSIAAPIKVQGKVIGAVGVGIDITEQKTAEQQFRAFADSIPQLAWIADGSGYIYWYNRKWFAYTGTTLDEMKGWGWRSVHHPEHVDRVVAKFSSHLATGQAWEDVFPIRGQDGRYRWFLSRATPIRDDSGKVVRWFGTNTDVTEQRRLEEAREQFMAILGHDLRNPLAAIAVSADLLLQRELDPFTASIARRIYNAAKRMRVMVSDLLDFTSGRLGGGIPVERKRTDVADVAGSVVNECEAAHPHRTITVDLRGDAVGMFDPERIAQVLQNLLTNALQHGDATSPVALRIDGTHRDYVTIEVSNRGTTISADMIPHLFEPFRRLAQTGKEARRGLGLGLFIVSEIAAAHGGSVSVRSTEENGTTFTVRLPRRS